MIHRLLSCRLPCLVLPLAGLTALMSPALSASTTPLPSGTISAPPTTPAQKSALLQLQDAFTKIAATVEPTVVNIRAERVAPDAVADGGAPSLPLTPRPKAPRLRLGPAPNGGPATPQRLQATGSGVIVRPDGYILTNDHVVEGATNGQVLVTLADGRQFKGRVFPDYKSDLAVVKIDPGATPLPAATFADSAAVRPGQWALAVGSPFDLQNTLTIGVISATGRHQTIGQSNPDGGRYYPDLLQTDAAINPGNSGGPLFNIDGQVVGINVAIESPVEGSAGVGFAIPSDMAQQILTSLISQGKVIRGQLGVVPEDLTPALQQTYGVKQGAFLREVMVGSAGWKAGLRAADVVTSFDRRPVTGEVTMRLAINETAPSKQVAIGYVRAGQPAVATATVGTAPADPAQAALGPVTAGAPLKLGLVVRDLLPKDRVALGLPPTTTGVVVTGAEAGSAAEQAGMGAAGGIGKLIIQQVGTTSVSTRAEFNRAVAAVPPGSPLTLVVLYQTPKDNQVHQRAFTIQL